MRMRNSRDNISEYISVQESNPVPLEDEEFCADCFSLYILLFLYCVQVYGPLPLGGNLIAVNKYRTVSYSKASLSFIFPYKHPLFTHFVCHVNATFHNHVILFHLIIPVIAPSSRSTNHKATN